MYKKDSIQVLNLFSSTLLEDSGPRDVPKMPAQYKTEHLSHEEARRREEEQLMQQLGRFDDNVKHAILLRREKDPKTEFYRKLETLTERINVYK